MKRLWYVGLLLAMPGSAFAQARPEPPTIVVDGTASVARAPDRAVLSIAVENSSALAQEAAQTNADAMTRVTDALRQAGIPASMIRTVSYRVDPIYSQPPRGGDPQRVVEYRATNMLRVTVDSVSEVGSVIDAAIGAGANRVAGLSFELRDPAAARTEALELAMDRARMDAETVARAAGHALGQPLRIQVGGARLAGPSEVFAGRAVQEMAATPVEAGTLTVHASVNVVYRLLRR